ncbi:hypothetical protein [Microbispora sp. NPDC049125]|uniref:hypothetical protein n=1 Tax=Microbispora sp. NPDC049125 TaxID=3154929 RepID=UPI0034654C4C
MKPGETRYSAAWSPAGDDEDEDDLGPNVTLIVDRWAGISGPNGAWPAADLEEAAKQLFDAGFLVTTPWELTPNGFYLARLSPMFGAQ